MIPYFITGLPRSRTAWLSNALTYGDSTCLFEPLAACNEITDMNRMLEETGSLYVGSSDCTYLLLLNKILELWEGSRLVVVVRDIKESIAGINKLGWRADTKFYDAALAGMQQALALPQTLRVEYGELSSPQIGEAIWNHCVPGTRFNHRRWTQLSELNVQVQPELEQAKVSKLSKQARRLFGAWDQCGTPSLH